MNYGKRTMYSNKDLFDMINKFKTEVEELEKKLDTALGNKKEYIGYITATISTLFLVLNYLK